MNSITFSDCATKEQLVNRLCEVETGVSLEEFQELTRTALALGIENITLAEWWEVSPAQIRRWSAGKNAPHSAMRPHLVRKLRDMLLQVSE